jgi:hypothetical protein
MNRTQVRFTAILPGLGSFVKKQIRYSEITGTMQEQFGIEHMQSWIEAAPEAKKIHFEFGYTIGYTAQKTRGIVPRVWLPDMARAAGFEPTTYGLEDRCSIH